MKLDVGSGKSPMPECVTVDLFALADIAAPMWDIPLKTGSVEVIYCRYAMEHLSRERVIPTLREFSRLLAQNGEIIITVPDFLWCLKNFLATPDIGRSMDYIFGGNAGIGDYHRIGYTEDILRNYCAEAGLIVVKVERNQDHYFENMVFHVRKSGSAMPPPEVTPAPANTKPKRPWRTS